MKILFCIACLATISLTASAQDHPKVELFGGYSYLRAGGETLNLTQAGATGTINQDSASLNGFNLSVVGNLTRTIGIVGDVGGHYGTLNFQFTSPGASGTATADASYYTFLFGPQFHWRSQENKNTLFVRPMIGVIRARQSNIQTTLTQLVVGSGIPINPIVQTVNQSADSQSTFSAAFGGGYDRKLSDRISVRVFQIDYVMSRFDSDLGVGAQSNLRISVGLTFH
jgi:hypothetical protein